MTRQSYTTDISDQNLLNLLDLRQTLINYIPKTDSICCKNSRSIHYSTVRKNH